MPKYWQISQTKLTRWLMIAAELLYNAWRKRSAGMPIHVNGSSCLINIYHLCSLHFVLFFFWVSLLRCKCHVTNHSWAEGNDIMTTLTGWWQWKCTVPDPPTFYKCPPYCLGTVWDCYYKNYYIFNSIISWCLVVLVSSAKKTIIAGSNGLFLFKGIN